MISESYTDTAVSPVISVILAVAVVVGLSVTVGVFVLDLGESLSSEGGVSDTNAGVAASTADIHSDEVTYTSMSGTGEDATALKFLVEADNKQAIVTISDPSTGDLTVKGNDSLINGTTATVNGLDDSSVDPGDSVIIPLNQTAIDSATEVSFTAVNTKTQSMLLSTSETNPTSATASDTETVGSPYPASEYPYSREVTINNPNSVELTGHATKIVVSYDSDMNSDFSDLRFGQGDEELEYWIENKTNGEKAIVWVNITSIPSDGTTITMYYGNSSASSLSNGHTTFIYFDDFDRSSLGANYSTYQSTSGGSFGINNGVAEVISAQKSFSNGQYWKLGWTGDNISRPYTLHTRHHDKQTTASEGSNTAKQDTNSYIYTFVDSPASSSDTGVVTRNRKHGTGETGIVNQYEDVAERASTQVDARYWTETRVALQGDDIRVREYNQSVTESYTMSPENSSLANASASASPFGVTAYSGYWGSSKKFIDWWFITSHADDPPTADVGAEVTR